MRAAGKAPARKATQGRASQRLSRAGVRQSLFAFLSGAVGIVCTTASSVGPADASVSGTKHIRETRLFG